MGNEANQRQRRLSVHSSCQLRLNHWHGLSVVTQPKEYFRFGVPIFACGKNGGDLQKAGRRLILGADPI